MTVSRPLASLARTAAVAGLLAIAVGSGAATASAASPSPPATAPGCSFAGAGGFQAPLPNPSLDPSIAQVVGDAANPVIAPTALALDTGDPRGRIFVADGLPGHSITIIDGRTLDPASIAVEQVVDVGRFDVDVAVDPATGRVFLADLASCRVDVLDGRAQTPSVTSTVDLAGMPGALAFEPSSGRLVVSLPDTGQVLVLNSDLTPTATLDVPPGPSQLLADPSRRLVFVAGVGPTGSGAGALTAIDVGAATPRIAASLAVPNPVALAEDAARGEVFVVERAAGAIGLVRVGDAGSLTIDGAAPLDVTPDVTVGPVSSRFAIAFIAGSDTVLVAGAGSSHAALYRERTGGGLDLVRVIVGVAGGVAALEDPATGRVFVAEESQDQVAVVTGGAPAAPAPALAYVLPGPLDISLAPKDVARSIGITAIVMLFLGAPTPLFNSTLSANRALIERWFRRRRPRALRGRPGISTLGRLIASVSHTWAGLIGYTAAAALLYAFLDPGFPGQGGTRTFGTTLFAVVFGTAISQVPSELYVRRRYGERGAVRVALWTLGLATACVVVTRITGVQPGYIYGIIGGFAYTVALSRDDRGRMAWRGMTLLLGAGVVAWLARIPFQPGSGAVGGGVGELANQLLAGIFITAVQSSAIGLIPLRFMTGAFLFDWSRVRWAVLWAAGLLLFAHVILYPVSSFEPHPSATGLSTVLLTVALYGAIAVGFWWFFERRARRRARRLATAASRAAAATTRPPEPPAAPLAEDPSTTGTTVPPGTPNPPGPA